MPKLTKSQREKLKQLVTDCVLNRFTTQETIAHIENKLNIKLSERYVRYAKQWLKKDMQKEFNYLRQDRYAYINEYFERVNEIKDLQRQTRMILNTSTSAKLRLKCVAELRELTVTLANLYDLFPAITARSFSLGAEINNAITWNGNGKAKDNPPEKPSWDKEEFDDAHIV